jgi:putative transposase
MSTHICNLVHFVWGTHERRSWIRAEWKDRLYGYLGGILRHRNAVLIAAGGVDDHVHVLASLPATLSLADAAAAMKANSSRWIRENVEHSAGFAWQEGYGAFSVSKSAEQAVTAYIRNQEEHHNRRKFQEEFIALLNKHSIPYDERYLWV